MELNEVLIPSSPADITPEWVSSITGHVAVFDNFKIDSNIQEGSGFLSSIYRIAYQTTTGETYQIIVKLLPEGQWLEYALADASDEREISVYKTVLPDILKVVPEIEENICKFVYACVKPADPGTGTKKLSMLVLEDLKPLGFKMMDFSGTNSDEVVGDLIKFLARLHFGSLAVEVEKQKPLSELYPFMQGIVDSSEAIQQWQSAFDAGFPQLESLCQKFDMPGVWEEYKKLKPHSNRITEKIVEEGKHYPCLIHSDVWPPNVQVHEGKTTKVIDWQLVGYRDPAYDLSLMLFTVLPKEKLNIDNLKPLVKKYYDEFETLCKEKGYAEKIRRRSWEEFQEFFFSWGVTFVLLLCLPAIECYTKDLGKYANVFRVLCEENHIVDLFLRHCT